MQDSKDDYAAYRKWLILLIFLVAGCKIVQSTPLPTEIQAASAGVVTSVAVAAQVAEATAVSTVESATPIPEATATPTLVPPPTPTTFFLGEVTTKMDSGNPERDARALPRHGLIIAVVVPLLFLGIPWLIFEFFTIRHVQPRGIDLSTIRIKAQDGLFIEARLSMTARKSLSIAAIRTSWSSAQTFVEKTLEQELIHQALAFPTLEDLERNLKGITDSFLELPFLQELSRDFGVEVLRFNVETRYPQETMDALNRKAEASAGGAAYLAYAAAAHLDPDTNESRELYKIFQETSGQVDAARNLGGGISSLAYVLGRNKGEAENESND
ncbi:MAG: hypothetical protein JXM69_06460 [Anaerolineae bacterium]|nr:hypothetical protein [Anaerolineae bacterium]